MCIRDRYYTVPGVLMTMTLPVLPFVLLWYVAAQELVSSFQANWMTDCPGACFFVKPKGVVNNLLWQWWLNLGMYTSIFMMVLDDPEGARHSVKDYDTTKEFWFRKGAECNARYPKTICSWDGTQLTMHHELKPTERVMLKITDSYLGIGDKIVQLGEGEDSEEACYVKDTAALEALCNKHYLNKTVIGTEFVSANPRFGVHQGDVLTMRLPDGQVHVLRCMYWGDCTGMTSHSCSSAYMVDYKSERITQPARWYSPSFVSAPSDRAGQAFPGINQAAHKCVEMHASITEHPWLNVVGWDVMSTSDAEEPVFFEGNFAGSRFRRHCFSSARILYETVKICVPFTPFGIQLI
eukprot:TRINITY_DN13537_c0_g1_i2.p1 TRINITY_DN13537_c0_g1~~TRINITY_DN13537_c0_g1_i2.p1  ORF type:complete len:351 (-),score=110.74 TRINITY_DN13537_c0_g1_i2:197-1249(-)